jgi:hypothetical protein
MKNRASAIFYTLEAPSTSRARVQPARKRLAALPVNGFSDLLLV